VQDKNVFLKGTAQVVMKSDLKYLIEQKSSLAKSCVSSCLVFRKGSEKLAS